MKTCYLAFEFIFRSYVSNFPCVLNWLFFCWLKNAPSWPEHHYIKFQTGVCYGLLNLCRVELGWEPDDVDTVLSASGPV